jgi:flagellar biosynthesis protein FlhF
MIRAASMPAALRAVRAELGEEALILSSRRVAGGFEVAAAVAPADEVLPELDELVPAKLGPAKLGPAGPDRSFPDPDPSPIARLAAHGVPAAIQALLPDTLRFKPLPLGTKPLLFTGPPGAGKTLTVAKLATRLCLAGQPPLVITTDGARAGAIEQLAAFTGLLELDLLVAPDPDVLVRALARREDETVLIDGAGTDLFDREQAAWLAALAHAADAIQVLVLPANLDAEEAALIAAAHARAGAAHLVPTRLDQARRIGAVLAAAAQGLAIGGFGTGAGPADGFRDPDPDFLAARLAVPPPRPGVFA